MGARFREYGPEVIATLKDVDISKPDTYHTIQKLLRENGMRKMYKEIFTFIYELGGVRPYVDNQLFDDCVTDFKWLSFKFQRMKRYGDTTRKNMPSMYVLMDLLLRKNGHVPYYDIPRLKDKHLQTQVMKMYTALTHDLP